jgi:uncharacterized protein
MVRLDEVADDAALSPGQRAEERLGSVDYDVWACPTCDERLVIPYTRWWSSIKGCPQCGFRTVRSETRTLRAATTASTGLEETRLTCANCDWRDVAVRETPRIQPSSGGSDGGGASAGGVSFGGSGSTAGGGGGASY